MTSNIVIRKSLPSEDVPHRRSLGPMLDLDNDNGRRRASTFIDRAKEGTRERRYSVREEKGVARRFSIRAASLSRRSSRQTTAEEFRFNLFSAKDVARAKLKDVHNNKCKPSSPAFARFLESDACNLFLTSSLFYFGALIRLFRMERLFRGPQGSVLAAQVKARRDLLRAKIDVLQCRNELSIHYADILLNNMQHFNPSVDLESQTQQNKVELWAHVAAGEERDMFETLLLFLNQFLRLCFDAKYYGNIEAEIACLFRTQYFAPQTSHQYQTKATSAASKKAMPSLRTMVVLKLGNRSQAKAEGESRRNETSSVWGRTKRMKEPTNAIESGPPAIHTIPTSGGGFGGGAGTGFVPHAASQVLRTGVRKYSHAANTIHGVVRKRSPIVSALFPDAEEKEEMRKLMEMEMEATLEAESLARSTGDMPNSPRDRPDSANSEIPLITTESSRPNTAEADGKSPPKSPDLSSTRSLSISVAPAGSLAQILRTTTPSYSMPLPLTDVLMKSEHWQSARDHEKTSLRQIAAATSQLAPSNSGKDLGAAPDPVGEKQSALAVPAPKYRRFSMLGPLWEKRRMSIDIDDVEGT